MAKFRTIKNALIGGEISPTALGRSDLPIYQFACETLLNMIPMLSGGAYRRPGTLYQASVVDGKPGRLIPFSRSLSENYMLVLSDGDTEVYQSITAGTVTGGTVTGSLPTLSDAIRKDIQRFQSVDVLYLVHPEMKPQRILRKAEEDEFKIADFDTDSTGTALTGTALREAWPYLAARTDVILTPNAVSGTGITISATKGGNPYAFFDAGHVGALFKLRHTTTYGCVKITAVAANGQSATADVVVNMGALAAADAFYESAWSDYRGWPRAITIFKERLTYGGTENNPDTLWFTKNEDYNVLSIAAGTAPSGSDPFDRTLPSTQLNHIQWLVSGETLLTGTSSDEWMFSTISDGTFGPDTASALGHLLQKTSSYGSAYKQAFRAGNSVYFVASNGVDVKELTYNDSEQAYVAEPLNVLYDEYPKKNTSTPAAFANPFGIPTDREFTSFVWDKSRSTIWCTDIAGNLFGCVRDRKLGVMAWHRHELGGSGKVVSATMLPNPDLGREDLWLCVERTVNTATVYHVERMIGGPVDEEDAYTSLFFDAGGNQRGFTDCSVITNDVGNDEFAVDHLQGESVVAVVTVPTHGLFAIPAKTVALLSDATTYGITFDASDIPGLDGWHYVNIGYAFNSIVEPVRFDVGSQIGTAQGARKRIHDLTVRFYKTIGCKYGPDASHLIRIIFRESSTPLNKSADLFTGDKKLSFAGNYDRDGYIYLLQDQPLPFAVCAVVAEGVTYD